MSSELQLDGVERVDQLSRDEFLEKYQRPGVPVVIKTLSGDWSAQTKWTPEFLKEKFGSREITALTDTGSDKYFGESVTMQMSRYVDMVINDDRDLRMTTRSSRELLPSLLEDFEFPDLGVNYSLPMCWLFLGPRGSRTRLHYDFDCFDVFHSVLFGRKTFYLFHQSQNRALYKSFFLPRSPIDPANPDFERYPRAKKLKGWKVVVDAGETLYLPAAMWHDVQYDEGSLALSLRFTEGRSMITARVLPTYLMTKVFNLLSKKKGTPAIEAELES